VLTSEEQAVVDSAISRGVRYLLDHQNPDGSWPGFPGHHVGMAALPGLTLLECGVAAGDPHVQNAARHVRDGCAALQSTYELALCILFLDRLGETADEPLIQRLALRLLAGQTEAGGWWYNCPLLTAPMERDLLIVLRHSQPRTLKATPPERSQAGPAGPSAIAPKEKPAPKAGAKTGPDHQPTDKEAARARFELPGLLKRIPAVNDYTGQMPPIDHSDNSNTQFAILGVWVASRHGVPTERALIQVARRFRATQGPQGGWIYPYAMPGMDGSPAMTGAGLLGLAVGLGTARSENVAPDDKATPPHDVAVEKGLRYLAREIGQPLGLNAPRPALGRGPTNLYFLWTLERVAVLFNLRQIDGKDWYRWGAEVVVGAQGQDGDWQTGGYPGSLPPIDTSFALLFLRRANLVQDLSKHVLKAISIKGAQPTRPGSRQLRPGE
jgi:hypothetical protein